MMACRGDMDDYGIDELIVRCGNLGKLVRSVAYFLRVAGKALRKNSERVYGKEISASEFNDALMWLVAWEQKKRLRKEEIIRLAPVEIDYYLENYNFKVKLTIVGGRIKNFPVGFAAFDRLPIIPYGILAKLIVLFHHDKHHRDADTTVSFVRNDFWVIKARKIASAIDARCRICKEKRQIYAGQIMGDLPDFRSQMSPPFSVCLVDLFGPLEIRDDCVKKGPRVYKKVWGIVFSCASTRAVHLDVSIDYSTESILHCVRRLMALRGDVRLIISDAGSQLIGASKELSQWRQGWDIEQLVRFGAEKGLEWRTIMPSSQHQNGASEILVKLVKGIIKSLLRVLGETKLSLNEMNTVMLEVSNLVNQRPIGIKPNARSASDFLCPNSLLLGRCSDRICSGPFEPNQVMTDCPKSARSRFHLVQAISSQFWQVWLKLYYPTLVVRQKWHSERRNLQVGDLCLLKDSNLYRGEWRLCEVAEVYPDRSKKVRNVGVRLKPRQSGTVDYVLTSSIVVKRHVSNLIVLVPAEERGENFHFHEEEVI